MADELIEELDYFERYWSRRRKEAADTKRYSRQSFRDVAWRSARLLDKLEHHLLDFVEVFQEVRLKGLLHGHVDTVDSWCGDELADLIESVRLPHAEMFRAHVLPLIAERRVTARRQGTILSAQIGGQEYCVTIEPPLPVRTIRPATALGRIGSALIFRPAAQSGGSLELALQERIVGAVSELRALSVAISRKGPPVLFLQYGEVVGLVLWAIFLVVMTALAIEDAVDGGMGPLGQVALTALIVSGFLFILATNNFASRGDTGDFGQAGA